jgi:hypothetical protein
MPYFKVNKLSVAMSFAMPALCMLCGIAIAADVKPITLPAVTVSDSKLDSAAPGATKLDRAGLAPRLSSTSDTRQPAIRYSRRESVWRRWRVQPACHPRPGGRPPAHQGRWHGPDCVLPQPHEPGAVVSGPDQRRRTQGLRRHFAGECGRRQHWRNHLAESRAPEFAHQRPKHHQGRNRCLLPEQQPGRAAPTCPSPTPRMPSTSATAAPPARPTTTPPVPTSRLRFHRPRRAQRCRATKWAPPPMRHATRPWPGVQERQPPVPGQAGFSGHAVPALPEPAHGHAGQHPEQCEPALCGPV